MTCDLITCHLQIMIYLYYSAVHRYLTEGEGLATFDHTRAPLFSHSVRRMELNDVDLFWKSGLRGNWPFFGQINARFRQKDSLEH